MRFIDRQGFEALLEALRRRGFELIGPRVKDGAIAFGPIERTADIAHGVRDVHAPGSYRLEEGNGRVFGFTSGPDSAKRFLFPPREEIKTVAIAAGHLDARDVTDEHRYAFIGLRACDLAAVAIQDKVFFGPVTTLEGYAKRRSEAFFVGVNCHAASANCFCTSMGTGPRCTSGFDLALTELDEGFLVEEGTDEGRSVLREVPRREATPAEVASGEELLAKTAASITKSVDPDGLRELLARNREHPRWDEIAEVCLACGNCTAVCPTCFCHDIVDTPDLLGGTATRTREWTSCFSSEFSHMSHTTVRSSGGARYRQWLTHKFSGWVDQFGTMGCVGCGRCITWCPAGIDITKELAEIGVRDGEVA